MENQADSKVNWGKSCILLTRVSTSSQDNTAQELDLVNYAKREGYENLHIIQTTESGFKKINSKQGFKIVQDYIEENHDCKTVFCTEISRIGRTNLVLSHVEDYFTRNKIQVYIKDISFKLFNEYGQIPFGNTVVFSLFGRLAESEMKQKQERFIRSKIKSYSEGYSIGGKELFGYERFLDEKVGKNTYKLNDKQAFEIRTIYDWYINGIEGDVTRSSISKITLECKAKGFSRYLFSKRNVNKALKEGAYTGFKVTNNKRKNPEYWSYDNFDAPKYIDSTKMSIKYPEIIIQSKFDKVQLKLSNYNNRLERNVSNNTLVDKSSEHITILSKMIVCKTCNHFYRGEYRIKDGYAAHSYICSHSKSLIPCTNKSRISMNIIDSSIWSFLKSEVSNLVEIITEFNSSLDIDSIITEIGNLKSEIINEEARVVTEDAIFRAKSRIRSKFNEAKLAYELRIDEINSEIAKIQLEIDKRENIISEIESKQSRNFANDIKTKISEIETSKLQLKNYFRQLIKKIVPLHSELKYTILNLVITESLGYSIGFKSNSNLNESGHPNPIKKTADINFYLLINKKDNHRIKLRIIENPAVKFQGDKFVFWNKEYNLDTIFSQDCWELLDEPFLSMPKEAIKIFNERNIMCHVREIDYIKLDVYGEDKPKTGNKKRII